MKCPFFNKPSFLRLFPILLIFATGFACILSNPTPSVWSLTPTAQAHESSSTAYAATQAASFKPLPTFTMTPSVEAPTPTTPAEGLSKSGPWLVYPTDAGQTLVILNQDGNGSIRVAIPTLLDANDLKTGLSPKGGVLAFRSGNASKPEEAALYLLYLPEGRLEQVTPLVSKDVIISVEEEKNERAITAVTGVVQAGSITWSPDGHYLAFIAALDRNSADLYLYDSVAKTINRMTFSSTMMATPYWSSDSQWIIAQEVSSFNGTAGWTLGSVLKINAQTDQIEEIYTPSTSSTREVFVGWASNTDLLSYSQNKDGGFSLRLIDTTYIKVTTLFSNSFQELSFDPVTKTIVFTVIQSGPGGSSYQTGLYLMTPNDTVPQQIQIGNLTDLIWSTDGNEFLASGLQGVIGVSTSGDATLLANEAQALPSPNGNWLVCWGDSTSTFGSGIRVYRASGNVSQAVTSDPVQGITWQPNSNGIFFFSGNDLYLSTFPSLGMITLDTNVHPGAVPVFIWVSAANS